MLAKVLAFIATLCYPFVIWLGLQHFGLAFLALFLLAIAELRLYSHRDRTSLTISVFVAILSAISLWQNQLLPLKLYPVIMNLMMLGLFFNSLYQKETIIEKFARLKEPDLPPNAVSYIRNLTKIWCVFFFFNGAIALFTAFESSEKIWALYNGFIAYLLIGALMGGEWLYRRYYLGKH